VVVEIEAFFDCTCVWAYLAREQIRRLAETDGIDISWRPVVSEDLFEAVNPGARDPLSAVKQAYYEKDVRLWADCLELALVDPERPATDANSVMLACVAADRWDRLEEFMSAAFDAAWAKGRDLADSGVVAGLWSEAGLPADVLDVALDWPEFDARLRANARELAARGGYGTPTFFIGHDMYFGNDSLPLIERALKEKLRQAER
jgi:2-hydroxychromene-2-carboxylate isomerase